MDFLSSPQQQSNRWIGYDKFYSDRSQVYSCFTPRIISIELNRIEFDVFHYDDWFNDGKQTSVDLVWQYRLKTCFNTDLISDIGIILKVDEAKLGHLTLSCTYNACEKIWYILLIYFILSTQIHNIFHHPALPVEVSFPSVACCHGAQGHHDQFTRQVHPECHERLEEEQHSVWHHPESGEHRLSCPPHCAGRL